jgi:hypothetical protein
MIIGILTNVGQQCIGKYISDYTSHSLYVAWGMCSTANAALETDTALIGELDRKVATLTPATNTLAILASKTNINPTEILEVGIFDAASGGNMLYRGLLSDDSVTAKSRWVNAGDTISVSVVLDFANGTFT